MASKFIKGVWEVGKTIFKGGKQKTTGTEVIKGFTSKIKGQSTVEEIKSKGKTFKSKMADEAKKAQEAEFKKKPWKKHGMSKKEYDDLPF